MPTHKSPSTDPERTWLLLLRPGIGIKRWLLAASAGILLTSVGLAFLLVLFVQTGPLHWLMLGFLPNWLRALLFVGLGLGVATAGVFRLHQIILREVWPELRTPESQAAVKFSCRRN